jgi:predicted DNA-binding transcriptional regulator YafY
MHGTSGRLLRLLSLLQARRDWSGEALAERLEVSPRTVRRDVDRLRELGYPVRASKGPDGGYRLDAGSELPPLLFDDEQAVAVAVALQTATATVSGIEDAALRALATVRQVMPSRLRHRVDALRITPVRKDGSRSTVDAERLMAIGAAVRAREVLRFDYEGRETPRRAEPHHVVTWGGRWYLVAWDLERSDWRTFRVDRMRPRTPTGPRFTPRELPAPDVASYISRQFTRTRWPCEGTAIVSLPAKDVARWLDSEALVEELGPDRCRVTTGSWSWTGLAVTLGLFEVDLEIVGPEELRQAAAVLATRYGAAAIKS